MSLPNIDSIREDRPNRLKCRHHFPPLYDVSLGLDSTEDALHELHIGAVRYHNDSGFYTSRAFIRENKQESEISTRVRIVEAKCADNTL